MSILITGMEMPEGALGAVPVIIFADGVVRHYFSHLKLGDAIPVPPHVDLVDREALMDDIICSTVLSGRKAPKEAAIVQEVLDIVGDANAIIPAEEGET